MKAVQGKLISHGCEGQTEQKSVPRDHSLSFTRQASWCQAVILRTFFFCFVFLFLFFFHLYLIPATNPYIPKYQNKLNYPKKTTLW